MISLYIINNTVLAFVIKFSYYANRSGQARITRNYPIQYRIIKISMNTGDVIREAEGEGEREREKAAQRRAALTWRCSIVFANLFTARRCVPPGTNFPP